MASNGYRQQWQQQPAPTQYYGQQGNDQRGWQDGRQPAHGYGQPMQTYNQHPIGQQSQPGYDDQQYYQNGDWNDQSCHEPYQTNGQAVYPEQYDQPQPSQHQYQYDNRYRANPPNKPLPVGGQTYESAQQPRKTKQKPAPVVVEKAKPRERILTAPASPKNVPWDNPFGAFPPMKKDHKEKHSSVDNKRDSSSRRPSTSEQRPRTSQGSRKADESRPHTSHSQRPGRIDTLNSPGLTPEMPPQKSPAQARSKNALMEAPVAKGLPSRPAPQRSAMAPNTQQAPQEYSPEMTRGDYRQAPQVAGNQWQSEPPRPPMPPTNVYEPRRLSEPTHERQPQLQRGDDEISHPYRGRALNHPSGNNRRSDSEVPNFGVVAAPVNGRGQSQAASNLVRNDPPVYQKQTYQAPSPKRSQPAMNSQQIPPANDGQLTSPLTGFAFNLPANHSSPALNADYSQRSPATRDQSYAQAPLVHNVKPRQRRIEEPYQPPQQPGAYFPPRSASRPPERQPKSAREAPAYAPNMPGDHQQRLEQGLPPRPNTSHAQRPVRKEYNMRDSRPTHSQEYAPNLVYGQQTPVEPRSSYNQDSYTQPDNGYSQNQRARQSHQSDQGVRSQQDYGYGEDQSSRPGYDPRMQFGRQPSAEAHAQELARPRTSNSAHPPPVRFYGDRASSDSYRTTGSAGPNGSGPDALPAHPAPMRAGLANGAAPQGRSQVSEPQQRIGSGPPPAAAAKLPVVTNTITVQELNALRETVNNNPNDHATGLKFAKRLVEAATVLASENGRADPKQTAKNRERYILDAHKLVKKLVSAGYTDAMFYLADCHGQGLLGLAPDPKEAFLLYQSAAKLGHPQSAYRVAVCCEMGTEDGGGTRRDPMKAMQWYKRAATLGDTPAMYKLGMILLKGLLGQPRNPREAVSWLKRAAERANGENPHALHELALLYESAAPNDSIVRDERYSLQLFQQAADLGYKYSQFRLGSAFEYGLFGCTIDPRQSIAWYSRAAAQGEHQSELALSGWYLTGSEPLLQQSDTEAYLWARKAAGSGLAKAEYAMGYFTEVGIGCTASLDEAKKWYFRAAAQTFGKARERLEDLKRGGGKMQKTRMSRSNVGKHNEGDCIVM